MSVALNQPHRRGRTDTHAGEPLWEACQRLCLRGELYRAGCDYGVVSRSAKIAMGMRIDGVAEGRGSVDDAQQIARDRVAVQRYRDAIRVLRGVSRYAYDVVETYCFEERHVAVWGDAHLAPGLDALAKHWGMIDRGINEGKPEAARMRMDRSVPSRRRDHLLPDGILPTDPKAGL